MSIRRVVPNIASARIEESRAFYTEFLGFRVGMDMGWIVTFVSPSNPTAQVSLVRGNRNDGANRDVTLSIEVDDVEEMHTRALSQGHPIVYPLTDEEWGVRRFHVTDPNGVIINIMSHLTQDRLGGSVLDAPD